jgi:hypothetical protein
MRRYFTLEEANALVPRVALRMERAVQLHMLVRRAMHGLGSAGVSVSPALLTEEEPPEVPAGSRSLLFQARATYEALCAEVRAIEALGAEVKGVEHGLVDFPSLLDGETEVLLCWKLGEKRIDHFHDPEAGFAGRRPVQGHRFLREAAHPLRT